MRTEEVRAILTICLLAAYSDDHKHDREREQIKQVADALGQHDQVNLPSLYQDVLMRRATLEGAVQQLTSLEARQMAYEMAVCVCDADGQTSEKERDFLSRLKAALGIHASHMPAAVESTAEAIADAPLIPPVDAVVFDEPVVHPAEATPHPQAADTLGTANAQRRPGTLTQEELDRKILNAAITNGAIELLPENLSTLAIIPLQMRLVYQIGQSYGYELDRGHIKDLLVALGVGLTSQYLEQAGRKLLGRLLGGGLLGGLGKQAVSSGMSFAATYALGHVATQYYAGGRTLSTQMLQDAYQHIMQDGRALQEKYMPQIQNTARNLNTAKIMSMVRGR